MQSQSVNSFPLKPSSGCHRAQSKNLPDLGPQILILLPRPLLSRTTTAPLAGLPPPPMPTSLGALSHPPACTCCSSIRDAFPAAQPGAACLPPASVRWLSQRGLFLTTLKLGPPPPHVYQIAPWRPGIT